MLIIKCICFRMNISNLELLIIYILKNGLFTFINILSLRCGATRNMLVMKIGI